MKTLHLVIIVLLALVGIFSTEIASATSVNHTSTFQPPYPNTTNLTMYNPLPFPALQAVPPDLLKTLPPLKQLEHGVVVKDITCSKGLQIISKAEDGSPACVRPDTVSKLIERGWGTDLEVVKVKNANASVAYRIDNGRILEVTAYGLSSALSSGEISGSSILIVSINAASNGTLIIMMPRILVDAKSDNHDDNFTILSNGQEIQYTETSKTITSRTLSIPFQWGTKHIEIIGYGYYNKQPPPTE